MYASLQWDRGSRNITMEGGGSVRDRVHRSPKIVMRDFSLLSSFELFHDDHPFIVLTETKFSIRYIPVWARYSPLLTRVEKAHAITLSP